MASRERCWAQGLGRASPAASGAGPLHNRRLELPAGAGSMGEDSRRRAGRPPQLPAALGDFRLWSRERDASESKTRGPFPTADHQQASALSSRPLLQVPRVRSH